MKLDHLAVAAESLEGGCDWVEDRLGLRLQPGGRHAYFGTHNLLLGLEDGIYLEVIAIDPGAEAPAYPRWFDLDCFSGAPRLSTWICQVDDLAGLVARYPEAGCPVALARGDLCWRMAVPGDGVLPFDGVFPALIEWDGRAHPSAVLPASGARLERLIVTHPLAETLVRVLAPVLAETRVVFETGPAALRAEISTPSGIKVLG
ncbi:MAG: VOC family protein [Roseovarius sp.]|nr:VOC family protein [Roseovarius sp.]